jgi:hypothetical protein
MYAPGPGAQIHDLNPGIERSGLFWTAALPADSVRVDLSNGFASMEAKNVSINDYGDFTNALFGGGPRPINGKVSFKVVWEGEGDPVDIDNDDDPSVGGGWAGTIFQSPNCAAQMEWTARLGSSLFVSRPLATSSSAFAEFGQEVNGVFNT